MSAPRRTPRATFRPRFTLLILYLVGFFFLFAMLFALPDLVEAARELPAGPEQLDEQELARGREIGRRALAGRIPLAFGAAVVVTGLAAWRRALPGLRD